MKRSGIYLDEGWRVSAGPDALEFDAWYQRARPKLLRLAQSRLRDRAEAEDVVQETALALWKQVQRQSIDNLDAYAARSIWQNALRRSGRQRDWQSLDEPGSLEPSVPAAAETAADAWELEAAIDRLPLAQQTVLRLRFYTGYSFQETANALSIGLNTAASRCRYALDALRHALNPQEETHEGREPEPGLDELRRRKRRQRRRNA
jgi:RNA polymerase sigma-70 factor (ECF subfamily)